LQSILSIDFSGPASCLIQIMLFCFTFLFFTSMQKVEIVLIEHNIKNPIVSSKFNLPQFAFYLFRVD